MTGIQKCDLYRFGKSKLFYGIAVVTVLIAAGLMLMARQDIRLGISVFGNLTAFRGADDVIRIGTQYNKGLGIFAAILISVFIGQEYEWKTWQNKWLAGFSRARIYFSKAILSSAASALIFLLFQAAALIFQIQEISGYMITILCGIFVYAALGAVLCMISMLIKNNTASIIACLGYILLCETVSSIIMNIGGFFPKISEINEWIIRHSIYGMSLIVYEGAVSPENIFSIFLNSMAIICISAAIGVLVFRKYDI